MNLVIFDIDGTLTDTNEVDNDCYQETFAETFNYSTEPDDWHGLDNITDSGILEGLLKNIRERGPTEEEETVFKESFFQRLRNAYDNDPACFTPIAGAPEAVQRLKDDSDWTVALATGGWRESALFKLCSAGISISGIPLATSDDAPARRVIVQKAVGLALKAVSVKYFEKVVSVGDGRWDVEAARKLGFSFIGIGDENQLHGWGAGSVKPDLRDPEAFVRLLEEAEPPGQERDLP